MRITVSSSFFTNMAMNTREKKNIIILLPVISDLESDRCLLIAHLLCEYLIVAKLGGRKFVPEGDKAMTYMYLFDVLH
jgi:hypothetical protein